MGNRENSIVLNKAFEFALKIISLNKELCAAKEYVISNQLLRSGTSIGANINEALGGVSRKDFQHKISIALKEANETEYWLKLLDKSGLYHSTVLISDVTELQKILASILMTSKSKS